VLTWKNMKWHPEKEKWMVGDEFDVGYG